MDERRPLAPNGSLRIHNLAGSVRVVAWDRDSVAVGGTLGAGERIHLAGAGKGMKLFVESADERAPAGSHLEVRVPAGSRVWVKTATGDVEAAGVAGGLDLNTVSGRILVSGRPRELTAETMDGDIEITGTPGWLRAKTASGAVTLRGGGDDVALTTVSGRVAATGGTVRRAKLETVTGDILFDAGVEAGGDLRLDTHSGAIDVALARGAGADVDASSVAGPITNRLSSARPLVGRYGRGAELAFSFAGGGADVVVRTYKGPVTLRHRAAKGGGKATFKP